MIFDWKKVLEGGLNRARYVERYSSVPHIHRENVAEHSYYVMLYSLLLWMEINEDADLEEILWRGLVHDLEESVTGDMLRAVKHYNSDVRDSFSSAGRELLIVLLRSILAPQTPSTPKTESKIPLSVGAVLGRWEKAKDSSIEGWIVKLADFLSVVSYVMIEHQFGNSESRRIRKEIAANLKDYMSGIAAWGASRDSYSDRYASRVIGNVVNDVIHVLGV